MDAIGDKKQAVHVANNCCNGGQFITYNFASGSGSPLPWSDPAPQAAMHKRVFHQQPACLAMLQSCLAKDLRFSIKAAGNSTVRANVLK